MRKGAGIICIVISVLLIVKGHDVGNSVASRVNKVLTGAPVDEAIKLYLVGIGLGLFGMMLVFWKKK